MPTKKTPSKKPTAKVSSPINKKVVEKKFNDVKKEVSKDYEFVKEESKVIAGGIGKWRETSSTEEKIYTIIGIILLVWGLYMLKQMIWGMLLIIVGLLFVTGYFVKKGK